jgi:hypothetical protein
VSPATRLIRRRRSELNQDSRRWQERKELFLETNDLASGEVQPGALGPKIIPIENVHDLREQGETAPAKGKRAIRADIQARIGRQPANIAVAGQRVDVSRGS